MDILIAEDDASVQDIMDFLMRDLGHRADIVSTGKEAVAQIRKNRYDMCILDVEMPEMNGIEAIKQIRSEFNQHYVPILSYTARSNYRDVCLRAGADDFIEKPCDVDKLYEKISELTVKTTAIARENDKIRIVKEMAVDKKHLDELRELSKAGLTKLIIVGHCAHEYIVDKRIQKKIYKDLIEDEKKVAEFLEEGQKPGLVHLYRDNFQSNIRCLLPEEIEAQRQKQQKELDNFSEGINIE